MLLNHHFILDFFFYERISLFICIFQSKFLISVFLSHIFLEVYILISIKVYISIKAFNISVDSSFLNIYIQIINVLLKIYVNLGLSNFLYLLDLMQKMFFIFIFLESIHKNKILVSSH